MTCSFTDIVAPPLPYCFQSIQRTTYVSLVALPQITHHYSKRFIPIRPRATNRFLYGLTFNVLPPPVVSQLFPGAEEAPVSRTGDSHKKHTQGYQGPKELV
jgi:hypothetical protein